MIDFEQEYYEEPDYEQFERKMLDLDREWERNEEPYEYLDSEQNPEGTEEAEEV